LRKGSLELLSAKIVGILCFGGACFFNGSDVAAPWSIERPVVVPGPIVWRGVERVVVEGRDCLC
jgi:hypothetical protein